jgi:hypothetical protein
MITIMILLGIGFYEISRSFGRNSWILDSVRLQYFAIAPVKG